MISDKVNKEDQILTVVNVRDVPSSLPFSVMSVSSLSTYQPDANAPHN